jgi:hypothetical protein
MSPATKLTAYELDTALRQFIGTTQHYAHWTSRITFTIGVHFLAEKAGAYWLIDLIASHQDRRLSKEEFQIWTLTVNRDKRPIAVSTCQADTGEPVLRRQLIEYTDFPMPTIKLWLIKGVLMLPSEY